MKRIALGVAALALVVVGGFYTSHASSESHQGYYSTDFTEQRPISELHKEKSFASIATHYGDFVKAEAPLTVPENQTARKMEDINENTKQIIVDGVVYVKK